MAQTAALLPFASEAIERRAVSPAETLARILPYLPAMGITRIANVTGLDTVGIPTVMVVRPNSRGLSVSQGKGPTLESAKVSGVMEAVETHHAERITGPLRRGSLADLKRQHHVLTPDELPRTTKPFDEHTPILWIEARNLASDQSTHVPFELVHTNLTLPLPEGSGFFPLTSNGLASGNTLLEALAHAIWELVERDATTLFCHLPPDRQASRRLRLDSVDDSCCRWLLGRYDAANVGVAVWETTSDLGIPAFLCQIVERELDHLRPIGMARGYGSHPKRSVALCRALSEAAQSRLTRIVGSRDDFTQSGFDSLRSPEAIAAEALHLAHEQFAPRQFSAVPDLEAHTLEEELLWTVDRLAAAGFPHVYFVDLSDAALPVHVVRVLVPFLEGPSWTPTHVTSHRLAKRSARLW